MSPNRSFGTVMMVCSHTICVGVDAAVGLINERTVVRMCSRIEISAVSASNVGYHWQREVSWLWGWDGRTCIPYAYVCCRRNCFTLKFQCNVYQLLPAASIHSGEPTTFVAIVTQIHSEWTGGIPLFLTPSAAAPFCCRNIEVNQFIVRLMKYWNLILYSAEWFPLNGAFSLWVDLFVLISGMWPNPLHSIIVRGDKTTTSWPTSVCDKLSVDSGFDGN